MTRRVLSTTPSAIRARELRLEHAARKTEDDMNAEVRALMDQGMTFDEAWLAAGGQIIPLVFAESEPSTGGLS